MMYRWINVYVGETKKSAMYIDDGMAYLQYRQEDEGFKLGTK